MSSFISFLSDSGVKITQRIVSVSPPVYFQDMYDPPPNPILLITTRILSIIFSPMILVLALIIGLILIFFHMNIKKIKKQTNR